MLKSQKPKRTFVREKKWMICSTPRKCISRQKTFFWTLIASGFLPMIQRCFFPNTAFAFKIYSSKTELISVVGVVLEICKEYEARTGRKSQIRINSVVRSIPYNRRIGGVRNSEHLEPLGHAVDIRFAYGTNSEYYNWHFKTSINRRNENMDKLIAAGARSFGFYRWGIHFGVREREKNSRFHKGIGYVVWDKNKKT